MLAQLSTDCPKVGWVDKEGCETGEENQVLQSEYNPKTSKGVKTEELPLLSKMFYGTRSSIFSFLNFETHFLASCAHWKDQG